MITKFKIFENSYPFESIIIDDIQVGDYVWIPSSTTEYPIPDDAKNFFDTHIGKVFDIKNNELVYIEYEDVPNEIASYFMYFNSSNNNDSIAIEKVYIKYWSKNKKDLYTLIDSHKYNI